MVRKLNKQDNMTNNKYSVKAKRHTNFVDGKKVDDYVEVTIYELSERFRMSPEEPVEFRENYLTSMVVGVDGLEELAGQITEALKSIKI